MVNVGDTHCSERDTLCDSNIYCKSPLLLYQGVPVSVNVANHIDILITMNSISCGPGNEFRPSGVLLGGGRMLNVAGARVPE